MRTIADSLQEAGHKQRFLFLSNDPLRPSSQRGFPSAFIFIVAPFPPDQRQAAVINSFCLCRKKNMNTLKVVFKCFKKQTQNKLEELRRP